MTEAAASLRRLAVHWKPDGWAVLATAGAGLIALPVLVVLGSWLWPAAEVWDHLIETVLLRYLHDTGFLLAGVGVGVSLIGVGTAWLVAMCRFPGRRAFEWLLLLPMAVPAYVIAYTYTGLLDYAGPVQSLLRDLTGLSGPEYWFPAIRTLPGAAVVMSLVLYPYVYLLTRAAFLEQSACALEVGRTLGRGGWGTFWSVGVPLARPSIAAGVALALMETLNDIGTVDFFGVDTLTRGVFRTWLDMNERLAGTQLAALMMVVVFALLWLERRQRGHARYHHATHRYQPLPRFRLRGARAALATAACAAPVILGFAIPAAALVVWSVLSAEDVLDARFVELALNSVGAAAAAGLMAVALALVLAYALRLRPIPPMRAAVRFAAMGYAVPGAVVAIGVMTAFSWADNTVDTWMRQTFGLSTGLILSGTMVAVLFAYLVRFLAVALHAVEAGLDRVSPAMDAAARTLGHGPRATLWRVHAPLIKGSVLTGGLLVFVDVMKELPATLILRPFGFNTLAARTYEYAADEQLVAASSPALAIVLAGIIPVILLSRAIGRSRPGDGTREP